MPKLTRIKGCLRLPKNAVGVDWVVGDLHGHRALLEVELDRLGFDTVNAGPLSESWRLERDRPAYVVRQNAEELRANLAAANRLP